MTQILLNWLLMVLVKILHYSRKNSNKQWFCQYSYANIGHSQGIILWQKTVYWTNDGNILKTRLKDHCDDGKDEQMLRICNWAIHRSFFPKGILLLFCLLVCLSFQSHTAYFSSVCNMICPGQICFSLLCRYFTTGKEKYLPFFL